MAVRTLLKKQHLPELKIWLEEKGYRIKEPKGIWEVFRACNSKTKKTIILHKRLNGIEGSVTVMDCDVDIIRQFMKERKVWRKILSEGAN